MRKAVIDIGTNSARLYVADINNEQTKILKLLKTTRLGEGIHHSNLMGEMPMSRTVEAVKNFVVSAKELDAEEIFIYATAVVREAKNKDAFMKKIKDATDIELHIISGELEGKIAFLGASKGYENPAVIDIGGGSTEVVTNIDNIFKALSEKTGGVRLKEQFDSSDGTVNVNEVKEFVKNNYLYNYEKYTDIKKAKVLIGVSGTPTTLASLFLGLKTYISEKIQGFCFKKSDLDEMLEILAKLNTEERKMFSGEFAERADIVVYGGCILSAFMEHYNYEEIIISDRDSLEGYLEYKFFESK